MKDQGDLTVGSADSSKEAVGACSSENAISKLARRRWWFVAAGALVYGTNYTDKVVFGAVGPKLITTFHFTKVEFGLLATIFGLTYTILQVPVAWFTDRRGRRKGVARITAFYGAWTVITGFAASSFLGLGIARAFTGAGESGSMPSVTGAVTPWVGTERRAVSQGVMHSTTRIASAITVPIAVATYLAFGIKGPFITFGAVTLLVAVFWAIVYRDRPIESLKRRSLRQDLAAVGSRGIRSKSLWALCLADFCYFYVLTIYIVWLPTYLVQSRHFSLAKAGKLGAIPWIGGAIGGILLGQFSDLMCKRSGNIAFWRRVVPSVCLIVTVPLLMGAVYSRGPLATVLLFAASFFVMDGTIAVFWAIAMDMGGHFSGSVSAWMNTWANIGGLLSPVVFALLLHDLHSYIIPFWVGSVLLIIAAGLVWLIDPTERLDARVIGETNVGATSG